MCISGRLGENPRRLFLCLCGQFKAEEVTNKLHSKNRTNPCQTSAQRYSGRQILRRSLERKNRGGCRLLKSTLKTPTRGIWTVFTDLPKSADSRGLFKCGLQLNDRAIFTPRASILKKSAGEGLVSCCLFNLTRPFSKKRTGVGLVLFGLFQLVTISITRSAAVYSNPKKINQHVDNACSGLAAQSGRALGTRRKRGCETPPVVPLGSVKPKTIK